MMLTVSELNQEAVKYCGTVPEEGVAQLHCLQSIGLQPYHKVLEIGCGALVAGIPIMSYLKCGNYYGVEPNKWLIDETLKVPENKEVVLSQCPYLTFRDDFDSNVSHSGVPFDYILSHSIVSHVSIDQLDLFLKNSSKMLKPDGFLLFSAILTNLNETIHEKWEYPGSVFISRTRVSNAASKYFGKMEERLEMTKLILEAHSSSYHDWILMTEPKPCLA